MFWLSTSRITPGRAIPQHPGRYLLLLGVAALSGASIASRSVAYEKKPNHGGIYVIAHRGVHEAIPENTLAAYRKAIEVGADFVEIDLRTTRDGHFVSIHNASVDAYTVDGTRGKVRELSLQQLKSLDIGSRIDPKWSGERVPTLGEILELCRGKIGIYLDLKDAPIDRVARVIQDERMQRHVVWCIHPDQVAPLRRACRDCIPMPDPESESTLPALLEQAKPSVVAPVWSDFSSTFAAKCHAAGALVFVDEQKPTRENWELALEWGADGIQTDAPRQLIEFLQQRP